MHLTGLAGEPRQYAQLNGLPGPSTTLLQTTTSLQLHITFSAIFLSCAQLPFLINLIRSARSRTLAAQNPWKSTTMEWAPGAFDETSEEPMPVYRGPCHYAEDGTSFTPQWQPAEDLHPPLE
jgi:cytochrome c oxidase subunit 1